LRSDRRTNRAGSPHRLERSARGVQGEGDRALIRRDSPAHAARLRSVAALFFLLSAAPGSVCALSETQESRIRALLEEKLREDGIPGLSIAIADGRNPIWAIGLGEADVENGVPAEAGTVYRSASLVKPMTATAALQLADAGRLDLDASVESLCPVFPAKSHRVTPRALLSHTAGIRTYPTEWHAYSAELYSQTPYPDVASAIQIFADDPLAYPPGSQHVYSSYGYNLLGCAIEGASGQSFFQYLEESVLSKARMRATEPDDPARLIAKRSRGYVRTASGTGLGELRNVRYTDLSNKVPGGGLVTTAPDVARFASAFLAGELVSPTTAEEMMQAVHLEDGTPIEYGLGWGLEGLSDFYGMQEVIHGGMTPGVSSILYTLPARRFVVVIMMNLYLVEGRIELAREIAKVALDLDDEETTTVLGR